MNYIFITIITKLPLDDLLICIFYNFFEIFQIDIS